MRIEHRTINASSYIKAEEEFPGAPETTEDDDFEEIGNDAEFDDVGGGGFDTGSGDTVDDSLEDIADTVDDMQDQLDDVEEDDTSIETENNIKDHYIAECDRCHGIFISAVLKTEEEMESVKGTCPLCGKESEQFLKWFIQEV